MTVSGPQPLRRSYEQSPDRICAREEADGSEEPGSAQGELSELWSTRAPSGVEARREIRRQ